MIFVLIDGVKVLLILIILFRYSLYRSNRLPMQTLDWKSPIDIRKTLLGASY